MTETNPPSNAFEPWLAEEWGAIGFDVYLLKPVEPVQLFKAVQAKIDEKREEDMFLQRALNERTAALRKELGLKSPADKPKKKRASRKK